MRHTLAINRAGLKLPTFGTRLYHVQIQMKFDHNDGPQPLALAWSRSQSLNQARASQSLGFLPFKQVLSLRSLVVLYFLMIPVRSNYKTMNLQLMQNFFKHWCNMVFTKFQCEVLVFQRSQNVVKIQFQVDLDLKYKTKIIMH